MNLRSSPRLIEHPRNAPEIAAALDRLAESRGFAPAGADPLRDALVKVAARYGEIVTQCLNAAPGLHLHAFAALLGGEPRPAQAASVHVTFKPAAGRGTLPIVVPMHTRLAAAPAEGESEPVVFETQEDIELVRAEAVRAFFADAGHRRVADVGSILWAAGREGDPLANAEPVGYALQIGQRAAFGAAGLKQVRVRITLQEAGSHEELSTLEWAAVSPEGDIPLTVVSDTTGGLSRSGEVVLAAPAAWPVATIEGKESLWLTLRLHRAAAGVGATAGRWRPPCLSALAVDAIAATSAQPVAAACHDGAPLDISKDVFAFGERPRFGSVFQLQSKLFAEAGARVELRLRLANPEGAPSAPIPTVSRAGRPVVAWEISTAAGYQPLLANDGSRSLTQDGTVVFIVPDNVAPVAIAGKAGVWLRARLASGHYGNATAADGSGVAVVRAPAINSMSVRSTLERGPLQPEHLVASGALVRRPIDPRLTSAAEAFVAPDVDGPALYIALAAVAGALTKGRQINWHVRPVLPPPPLAFDGAAAGPMAPRWQLHAADGWKDVSATDSTSGLTRSGIVKLKLPDEPAPWLGSALDPAAGCAWLRIVWPAEEAVRAEAIVPRGLAINSVPAQQSQRLRNEVVGSSNGRSGQTFKALRTPIVGAVVLQVRELGEEWVTWQEVDKLSASGAASRDFTLDRSTGELRFGDGRHGRIPPPGANNIRLLEYAAGGGSRGNRPPAAIAQMRSAVPAVESVTNLEPATGGIDADDPARVHRHASAWLRHRDRAVCADDFADLALRASPEVARAFCYPGRDLATGPVASAAALQEVSAGVISVIVVPHGVEARPQPGLALLAAVKAFLDARRPPVGRLITVGPTYARVAIQLQVAARAGWSPHELAQECRSRLAAFLHPVTGGADGRGWAPGQRPHRSDVHGILGALEGVDVVRRVSLSIEAPEGMPFVVSAGDIDILAIESP